MDETHKEHLERVENIRFFEARVRLINTMALGWAITLLALWGHTHSGTPLGFAFAVASLGAAYFCEQSQNTKVHFVFRFFANALCFGSWVLWAVEVM